MEFETDKTSQAIDDATRLAASTRSLTLTPLNETIASEDESDDLIATRNVLGGPIANIPSDAEVTTPLTQQQIVIEKKNHHTALAISLTVVGILIAATAYLFITK